MTVNLGAFAPLESVRLDILQPDGVTETGWHIDVLSSASPKAVAYSRAQSERSLRRQALVEAQQQNGRKAKPDDRTVDDVRQENIAFAVSRVCGWGPVTIPELGDGELPFSDENAARLFALPAYGWVYVQLLEFMADERNFTRPSATG